MYRLADVENCSCKAGRVLADFHAIQPHCRTELRLVDAQGRDFPEAGNIEGAAIPEIITVLTGDAGGMHDGAARDLSVASTIEDQLTAVELVDLGKARLCGVRKARDWNLVSPFEWNGVEIFRVLDLPGAIEQDDCALRRVQRRQKRCEENCCDCVLEPWMHPGKIMPGVGVPSSGGSYGASRASA
jgi:hypothetical protein